MPLPRAPGPPLVATLPPPRPPASPLCFPVGDLGLRVSISCVLPTIRSSGPLEKYELYKSAEKFELERLGPTDSQPSKQNRNRKLVIKTPNFFLFPCLSQDKETFYVFHYQAKKLPYFLTPLSA